MADNEDLEEVVSGFRAAEDSMRALTANAGKLQTAAEALAEADEAVRSSAIQLTNAATGLNDLSIQLGVLTAQLSTTSEALLKADPEGVKRELGRNFDQTERLRSRIDEATGETRSNFDAITRSLNQVKIIAVLAMVFALAAAALVLFNN